MRGGGGGAKAGRRLGMFFLVPTPFALPTFAGETQRKNHPCFLLLLICFLSLPPQPCLLID